MTKTATATAEAAPEPENEAPAERLSFKMGWLTARAEIIAGLGMARPVEHYDPSAWDMQAR